MGRRHFGSIRELKSGRYQARYKGPDGRMRPAEHTFKAKGDAQRYLSAVEVEMHGGTWTDPARRAVPFGTYADRWLRDRTLAQSTRDLYERQLRLRVKPEFATVPVGRIHPEDVRSWHTRVLEKDGPTQAQKAYSVLRTIMNTAVSDGLIPSSPVRIRGAGTVIEVDRPLMSREQAAVLMAAMPEDMQIYVLVTLQAHLRRGELLALRWGDVDLARGVLHIRRSITRTSVGLVEKAPKNGKSRSVTLPVQSLEALTAHLASTAPARDDERLFKHRSGGELLVHHIQYAWTRAREKAGITQFTWHGLRHAGLTWFAQEGATLAEIMERGGHRSVEAAMRYQHAEANRASKLVAGLALPSPGPEPQEMPEDRSGTPVAQGLPEGASHDPVTTAA